MNTLIIIDHTTRIDALTQAIANPVETYTLYMPTKKDKPHWAKLVDELCKNTDIPPQNHITIPISAIIQKTWRIIKHYTTTKPTPDKYAENRKSIVKKLSDLNHQRLANIESTTRNMIIQDQAHILSATVKDLT